MERGLSAPDGADLAASAFEESAEVASTGERLDSADEEEGCEDGNERTGMNA